MQKLGSLCVVSPGGGGAAPTMPDGVGHLEHAVSVVWSTPHLAQSDGMGKVELRAYLETTCPFEHNIGTGKLE
jgi:hypothetical protein